MKELVAYFAKNLADSPDQVSVEESERQGTTHYKLNVAESDKGRIIGKQGKVIKAMRQVLAAAASKTGKKTSIDID